MIKKYLTIITIYFSLITILYLYLNISYECLNFTNTQIIKVNVNIDNITQTYELSLGSDFSDLKKFIDTNKYETNVISDDYCLYDNQTIYLYEKNDIDKISINDDDINNLIKLKGIGEKTALKIIEYRKTYGDFKSLEEIKNVSGIGDKKYEKIKEFISL